LRARWLRGQHLDAVLCLGDDPAADIAFLEAGALSLLPVSSSRMLVERGVALGSGDGLRGLIIALERVIADPLPFAAIAAAAEAHVWAERSALAMAERIGRLLREE